MQACKPRHMSGKEISLSRKEGLTAELCALANQPGGSGY